MDSTVKNSTNSSTRRSISEIEELMKKNKHFENTSTLAELKRIAERHQNFGDALVKQAQKHKLPTHSLGKQTTSISQHGFEYPTNRMDEITRNLISLSTREQKRKEERETLISENLVQMRKDQQRLIELTIQAQTNESLMAEQAEKDKRRSFIIAIIGLLLAFLSVVPPYTEMLNQKQTVADEKKQNLKESKVDVIVNKNKVQVKE